MGDAAIPSTVPDGRERVLLLSPQDLPQTYIDAIAAKFPDADFEYHKAERGAVLPGG